jgi:hypothetical protein
MLRLNQALFCAVLAMVAMGASAAIASAATRVTITGPAATIATI